MKRALTALIILLLLPFFMPACESAQVVRFQLKIADSTSADYYICAEGQDIKAKIQLAGASYTEGSTGILPYRIYDVTVQYPAKVNVREDGRSFWTIYMGYVSGKEVTYSNSLKNIGIRSGHTTVDMIGSGKVFYDTVKTVYSGDNFILYADEGMEGIEGSMLYDTQFVYYEKDGERIECPSVLTSATIKLLGQNAPYSNGEAETWFSVISGAEGVGEVDRFCVTIKTQEPQPACTLTYAHLPDVVSEEGAKWLAVSEFAADGIKADTDVAAMIAAFGEPISSWGEYESQINYMVYQYVGVSYKYETGILDRDGWEEVNWTFNAVFTKNLVEFPRGIQIGDRFEDVLKKFPQEIDYKKEAKDGLFFGDYWRKSEVGWGAVQIEDSKFADNGVSISVICDDYWPMIQVHFDDQLIADKIVVQFASYPFG